MSDQDTLYNLLKESFLLLDFGDRQLFGRYKLTAPRFYALVHLGDAPGISLKQLSDKMFCDKSNATRIIKGLEADGYVKRQKHEQDGRTYRLFLTERGANIRRQVIEEHRAYNQNRFDCISNLEQNNITDTLAQLNRQLQASLQTN